MRLSDEGNGDEEVAKRLAAKTMVEKAAKVASRLKALKLAWCMMSLGGGTCGGEGDGPDMLETEGMMCRAMETVTYGMRPRGGKSGRETCGGNDCRDEGNGDACSSVERGDGDVDGTMRVRVKQEAIEAEVEQMMPMEVTVMGANERWWRVRMAHMVTTVVATMLKVTEKKGQL